MGAAQPFRDRGARSAPDSRYRRGTRRTRRPAGTVRRTVDEALTRSSRPRSRAGGWGLSAVASGEVGGQVGGGRVEWLDRREVAAAFHLGLALNVGGALGAEHPRARTIVNARQGHFS